MANFLFFECSRRSPAELTPASLARALFDLGIMVRPTAAYGFPAGLRVSVGTREENVTFLETFDGVLGQR